MYDKKDEIVVKVELPGIEKDQVDITLSEDTLTIKGEAKKEEEVKDEDYYRCERCYGSFSRTINLPARVQGDKSKATFKNGILEICLPKAEEAKPKEIKVEVK
ncbi:MAG: Hsp20/alpha crystallin family protein [Nitrospirota bacterium]